MPWPIFISYARKDKTNAERFYDDISRDGIKPFIDLDGIPPGDFEDTIKSEISEAHRVVLLVSEASLARESYVEKELHWAKQFKKTIVPVWIKTVSKTLEEQAKAKSLGKLQWYFPCDDWQGEMTKLRRFLLASAAGDVCLRETFSNYGPDLKDWEPFQGWKLDDANAGEGPSQSLYARAQPNFMQLRTSEEFVASLRVQVPPAASLDYSRRLRLKSANMSSEASFRVFFRSSGKAEIDQKIAKGAWAEENEQNWQSSTVDLGKFGDQSGHLEFMVAAEDTMSVDTFAEAWIDDIVIRCG